MPTAWWCADILVSIFWRGLRCQPNKDIYEATGLGLSTDRDTFWHPTFRFAGVDGEVRRLTIIHAVPGPRCALSLTMGEGVSGGRM